MNVKVCRNCLQTLTPERRERGLSTCANCAKTLQALKDKENPPVDNPPSCSQVSKNERA